MGNSSRRPHNISKIITSLDKGENPAKLPKGPTTALVPGPILFRVAITAVTVVSVPKLSKLSSATEISSTTQYTDRKAAVPLMALFSTFFLYLGF